MNENKGAASSVCAESKGQSPRAKAKKVNLQKLCHKYWALWHDLDNSAKANGDTELKALAEKAYALNLEAQALKTRRALAEAERKDRRAGNPVLWTVFKPDNLLGMEITMRTPNRKLRRRIPTEFDLLATAVCEGKDARESDRYKVQADAARPADVYADLAYAMRSWRKPEEEMAEFSKHVDNAMEQWRTRHERARQREAEATARRKAWGLEEEAA